MTPYIGEEYQKIECHNPLSGHRWTEYGRFLYFTVHGGKCGTSKHRTLAGAERELEARKMLAAAIQRITGGKQ